MAGGITSSVGQGGALHFEEGIRAGNLEEGPSSSLELPYRNILEPNEQPLARMDLQPDGALHSHIVLSMRFIIEPTCPLVVGDGHTVDDRPDAGPPAEDLDIVPHVLFIGMGPFPALGGVLGPGIGRVCDIGFAPLVSS